MSAARRLLMVLGQIARRRLTYHRSESRMSRVRGNDRHELFASYFEHHQIREHVVSPGTRTEGYLLANPKRTAHHVWIWQLPAWAMGPSTRLTIYGDHHVTDRPGIVSSLGYDLRWFGEEQAGDYLAEKFLSKRWTSERCIEALQDESRWEERAGPNAEQRRDLVDRLDGTNDHEAQQLLEAEWEWAEWGDEPPGYGYDLSELASLSAIQRTFRRLVPTTPPHRELV